MSVFCKNRYNSGKKTNFLARKIFSSSVNNLLLAANDDELELCHQDELVFLYLAEGSDNYTRKINNYLSKQTVLILLKKSTQVKQG